MPAQASIHAVSCTIAAQWPARGRHCFSNAAQYWIQDSTDSIHLCRPPDAGRRAAMIALEITTLLNRSIAIFRLPSRMESSPAPAATRAQQLTALRRQLILEAAQRVFERDGQIGRASCRDSVCQYG